MRGQQLLGVDPEELPGEVVPLPNRPVCFGLQITRCSSGSPVSSCSQYKVSSLHSALGGPTVAARWTTQMSAQVLAPVPQG